MIDPKELILGSCILNVEHRDLDIPFLCICNGDTIDYCQKYPNEFDPIEISDEWLTRIMFDEREEKYFHKQDIQRKLPLAHIEEDYWGIYLGEVYPLNLICQVQYIHQVQNLYYNISLIQ